MILKRGEKNDREKEDRVKKRNNERERREKVGRIKRMKETIKK